MATTLIDSAFIVDDLERTALQIRANPEAYMKRRLSEEHQEMVIAKAAEIALSGFEPYKSALTNVLLEFERQEQLMGCSRG